MSTVDALRRIDVGWKRTGVTLTLGDVCWLANTPAADAIAERVRGAVNDRLRWPPAAR
jgi:hypothetical protein